MGTAAYYRFTTRYKAREQEGYQQSEVEKYARENAIKIDRIFRDEQSSGWVGLDERPEGRRLLDACDTGEIDTVLVHNPDALGTDSASLMLALQLLRERGITVEFVQRWRVVEQMIGLLDAVTPRQANPAACDSTLPDELGQRLEQFKKFARQTDAPELVDLHIWTTGFPNWLIGKIAAGDFPNPQAACQAYVAALEEINRTGFGWTKPR